MSSEIREIQLQKLEEDDDSVLYEFGTADEILGQVVLEKPSGKIYLISGHEHYERLEEGLMAKLRRLLLRHRQAGEYLDRAAFSVRHASAAPEEDCACGALEVFEPPSGYDPIAEPYAEQFYGELEHKPFDRGLLDRFAARTSGAGPVCDLGCGPGQIARYLKDRGADAFGIDLSPAMVETARRLNPDLAFERGDLLALEADDESWAGIAAFYSIIHLPPPRLADAFGELYRVLAPGGLLLLAFHAGEEVLHIDEWRGVKVSLDYYFFTLETVLDALVAAGFDVEEAEERAPYEGIEHPSRRAYVLARKP
jgi:SAM-dependent methyltransferase